MVKGDVDRVKGYIDSGLIDPVKIAQEIEGLPALQVAYIIDTYDLMPSTIERGELYESDSFIDLAMKTPGILEDTRFEILARFHENYAAKLFAEGLKLYLDSQEGTIFEFNKDTEIDPTKPISFVRITYRPNKGIELKYLNGNAPSKGFYTVYLGNNYTVVFDNSVFNNRKAVFEELSSIFLSRKITFVDCSQEELNVVQQLESAFLLASVGRTPVSCRFKESFLIEWLSWQGKRQLAREEVKLLARLLREKNLSIMTPARIKLYKASKGQYDRRLLTDIFFRKEEPKKMVSNINCLMNFNMDLAGIKGPIEKAPFHILAQDVPIKVAPLKGSISCASYLMKFYPGYGVLDQSKSIMVLDELSREKRSRLYLSFFYDPESPLYKAHSAFSNEVSKQLRERGLDNARKLIQAYIVRNKMRIEDIKAEDIAFLFSGGSTFSLCGIKIPHRTRLIMNKIFPDEYGRLSLESGEELFSLDNEGLIGIRKRAYFDDGADDADIYTSDELKRIKERFRENSKMAIKCYLALHPEKSLDLLSQGDLTAISAKMLRILGGSSVRVCLNRLMPDQFLILDEEKSLHYLMAKDRDKFSLARRYIPDYYHIVEEEPDNSQILYDEHDIAVIRERTIENLRTLVKTLLKFKGFRFVEELGRHNTEGLIDLRILGNAFPSRVDGSNNFIASTRKLFFNDYGVLTEEKYRYWKHQATGPKKRYLSNVFFMDPDLEDGWTKEEIEVIKSQSKKNAILALKLYMQEEGILDIHNITKEMLIKGVGKQPLLRILGVSSFRSILNEIFPDDFAVLTQNGVKNYFSSSTTQKQALNYSYFGTNADGGLERYAEISGLNKKWVSNAIVMFLEFLRVNRLSWKVFGDDGSLHSDITFTLPDSVFRIFKTDNHHFMWIKEQIAPFLHPIEDTEAFYWINLAETVNLVKFWQLDDLKNTNRIQDVPLQLRARIAAKVFEHGYPFISNQRNMLAADSKALLLANLDSISDQLDGIEKVLSLACSDRYANVKKASWQSIYLLNRHNPAKAEESIAILMRSRNLSDAEVKNIPSELLKVVSITAGKVNSDLVDLLKIFGQELDLDQNWHSDQIKLIKGAIAAIDHLAKGEIDQLLRLAKLVIEKNFFLFYNRVFRILAKNIKFLTVDHFGSLAPIIPDLVFDSNDVTKQVGMMLVENLRLAYPVLGETNQAMTGNVLQDVKNRIITGNF